jgi:hypothetical protein
MTGRSPGSSAKEKARTISRAGSPESEAAAIEETAISGYINPIDPAIMIKVRVAKHHEAETFCLPMLPEKRMPRSERPREASSFTRRNRNEMRCTYLGLEYFRSR